MNINIISASRRTDIPAFYTDWFMNRIRAEYCTVVNPFNAKQISRIELGLEDVKAIVFWTRWPKPLMKHLKELNDKGYKYYFQFTITGYGPPVEEHAVSVEKQIDCFKELSQRVGPQQVIWRYDPILVCDAMDSRYHLEQFERISSKLSGYTERVVISVVDDYLKTKRRLNRIGSEYSPLLLPQDETELFILLRQLATIAQSYKFEIEACAEPLDLSELGIRKGHCIDCTLLKKLFTDKYEEKKDKGQREACGCVISKDIGANNTCLFGCHYCYSTVSHKAAQNNHKEKHDVNSPSLIGWHDKDKEQTLWDQDNEKSTVTVTIKGKKS